jgi:formate-dependent nitrite reductase membrane component NrfD/ferredoxin
MYRRKDGIVDFNSARCIGCKACMQACPYNAVYIDPDRDTAAKCHFCAHRIEAGLEPACVAVCPERAIIAGDLDEPESEISQLLAREAVRVRKPEQGTKPKLFYIDCDQSALDPTAARHEAFYMWSERNEKVSGGGAVYLPDSPYLDGNSLAAYDVSHGRPWDWQVPVYSWMKSIGSGILAVPAIAMALGRLPFDRLREAVLSTLALIFIAATVSLLISDLSRKERFISVLKTPQSRSWLSRGAFILAVYSGLCGLFWLLGLTGPSGLTVVLLGPTVIAGVLAAGYTAFLFGQCEGCDLWQTPLLPLHMVVQALLSSGAVLALLPAALGGTPEGRKVAAGALLICLVLHLLILLGEIAMPPATNNAGYAARMITHGPYRTLFWMGAVVFGGLLPTLLLSVGAFNAILVGLSALLGLGGLLAFEWCFVMAGQRVPNS